MKTQSAQKVTTQDMSKKITVNLLLFMSIAISLSGVFFFFYSLIFNVSFKVINTTVSGSIFGLVVLYLGFRYFLMVGKLKKEVYGTTSRFSWSNLKPKNFFAKEK